LGVHNIASECALEAFEAMQDYTQRETQAELGDLLRSLHSNPSTLIVLNHPLWDEEHLGQERHRQAVETLLRLHGEAIDALEMNGLRPYAENLLVAEMAEAWGKPLVSGGDRHTFEPNVLLNVTNQGTMEEFVAEVRDGYSEILITSQYRRPLMWRMLDAVLDAVADHELHGLGWKKWNQRVFYHCDDGIVRSFDQIWGDRSPALVQAFTALARALHGSWVQKSLRQGFPGARQEAAR
jgi:hypothetical protein